MKERMELSGYVVGVQREPLERRPGWRARITLEIPEGQPPRPGDVALLEALEAGETVTLALETKDEREA